MQIVNEQEALLLAGAAENIAELARTLGYFATVAKQGEHGRMVIITREDPATSARKLPPSGRVEVCPSSRRYIYSGYAKEARILVSPHWSLKKRPLRLTKFTANNYDKAARYAIECLIAEENKEAEAKRREAIWQDHGARLAELSELLLSWNVAIPQGFTFKAGEQPGQFTVYVDNGWNHALHGPWTREEIAALCRTVNSFAAIRRGHNFRPESGASLAQREGADAKPA